MIRIVKKIIKRIFIVVFILIVLLLVSVEVVDRYWGTTRGAMHLYESVDQPKTIRKTASGVRYLEIGDSLKPPLLFIHGAPGSLLDGLALAKVDSIYKDYRLLLVERPGYGGTRPNDPEPSIWIQAVKCSEVLAFESQKALVVGHSYGAPIGVVLGGLFPDKVARVVSLSGQFDPENEIIFPISYWVRLKIFRWILPHMIWTSNQEKLNHIEAQRKVMDLYPIIHPPVMVVHGDADKLVPYENGPFIKSKLPKGTQLWTLPNKDHPIHFTDIDLVMEAIYWPAAHGL